MAHCRIIDVHNHPNWLGYNLDALVANMDQMGIEKTWLLSWDMPAAEAEITIGHFKNMDPRGLCAPLWLVVEGLQRHPDRFIGGWAPDPRDRHARAKLEAAVNLQGIRVCGELKVRMMYDNPDAIALYRHCAKLGLPVLFHLECPAYLQGRFDGNLKGWPEWYGGSMSVVETMCRLCPDTTFIGHAPGFWREISGDAASAQENYPSGPVEPGGALIDVLRAHGNLYCDLSGWSGCNALKRDPDHARRFVTEFQDRVLFGRDQFDRRLMDVLESLRLGKRVMDKALRGNAEKLLAEPAAR
ncbi:MAG: amidohydrolase family protein [Candidatus Sumerlaeota bacterium]|nr:amidohydrolase family protein [Candidatus Sumerlaeota bacterium]